MLASGIYFDVKDGCFRISEQIDYESSVICKREPDGGYETKVVKQKRVVETAASGNDPRLMMSNAVRDSNSGDLSVCGSGRIGLIWWSANFRQ